MMETAPFFRETWADIDLDAVADNVQNMKARLPEDVTLMAVVKANGYGHGALQVARMALESGAEWLAVALLDEALALRKQGIQEPILVLSPIPPQHAAEAAQWDISVAVSDAEWIRRAREVYGGSKPMRLHLACDTGMGRIGIRSREEAAALIDAMGHGAGFMVEGLFTHFATADGDDETYFNEQYQRFEMMVDWARELGAHPRFIHCGNSATALKYPAEKRHLFTMVRYGIAMYGLSPSREMEKRLPFPLKPALSLHSRLAYVKKVAAGSYIGYGATYRAAADEWIGTVPIGYADGWLRALAGSDVLVDGKRCPIIGRICMDQLMCRLPHAYPEGTMVTLIGRDGMDAITADELADRLHTINYEVTCGIHPRVPRIYRQGGKKIAVSNPVLHPGS